MEHIKVFYSGYCIIHNHDWSEGIDEYRSKSFKDKIPIIQKHHCWLQPPDIYELFNTDFATIRHFDIIESSNQIKMIEKISEVTGKKFLTLDCRKNILTPTDKDGNPDTFKLIKGQDIYKNDNGNMIKVYWNDNAPHNEIVPADEKPMSERERTTTLNIIYGLLDLLKKDGTSQNEIISELVRFGYQGLKKSTLESYFAEANKINERG